MSNVVMQRLFMLTERYRCSQMLFKGVWCINTVCGWIREKCANQKAESDRGPSCLPLKIQNEHRKIELFKCCSLAGLFSSMSEQKKNRPSQPQHHLFPPYPRKNTPFCAPNARRSKQRTACEVKCSAETCGSGTYECVDWVRGIRGEKMCVITQEVFHGLNMLC